MDFYKHLSYKQGLSKGFWSIYFLVSACKLGHSLFLNFSFLSCENTYIGLAEIKLVFNFRPHLHSYFPLVKVLEFNLMDVGQMLEK